MIAFDPSMPSYQGDFLAWVSKARELTTKALVRAATEDPCLAEAIRRGDLDARLVVKFIAVRVLRDLASRESVQDLDALWLAYLQLAQVPEEVIGRIGSVWLRRDQRFRRTLRARWLPVNVFRESIGDRRFPGRRLLFRILDAIDVVTAMSLIDRQERAFGWLLMQVHNELSHAGLSAADRAVLRPILESCKEVAKPLLHRKSTTHHEGTVNVLLAVQGDQQQRSDYMLPGSMIRFTFRQAQSTDIERSNLIGEELRRSMQLESWYSRTRRHILFKHDRREGMPPCLGGSGSLAFHVALQMCSHKYPMSLAPWLAISGGEGGAPVFGINKKVRVAKSEGIRLLITPSMFSGLCRKVRVLSLDAASYHLIFRNTAAKRSLAWAPIAADNTADAGPDGERRAAGNRTAAGTGPRAHLALVLQRTAAAWAAVRESSRWRLVLLGMAIVFVLAVQLGLIGLRPTVATERLPTLSLALADERFDNLRTAARERVERFRDGQTMLPSDPVLGDEIAWAEWTSSNLADLDAIQIVQRSFAPFTVLHHSVTHDARDWVEIRDDWPTDPSGQPRLVSKADRITLEPIQPCFFHCVYKLAVKKQPLASDARPGGWVALSHENGGWGVTNLSVHGVKEDGTVVPLDNLQIFPSPDRDTGSFVTILPGQPVKRMLAIVDLSPLELNVGDTFELQVEGIFWNGLNDQAARGWEHDWAAMRLVGNTHQADLTLLFRENTRRGVMYFTKPPDDMSPMDPFFEEIPERLVSGSVYQHFVEPGLDSGGRSRHNPPGIVGVRYTDDPSSIDPLVRRASNALLAASTILAVIPFGFLQIVVSGLVVSTLKPDAGFGEGVAS